MIRITLSKFKIPIGRCVETLWEMVDSPYSLILAQVEGFGHLSITRFEKMPQIVVRIEPWRMNDHQKRNVVVIGPDGLHVVQEVLVYDRKLVPVLKLIGSEHKT